MKSLHRAALLTIGAFMMLGFGGLVRGENATFQELQERMRERLPEINQLKQEGIVGENNQGYLEIRREATPAEQARRQAELVAAENADRRRVYTLIGAQQKAAPALVGRRRARQILEAAAPGGWVQRPDGEWMRKPEENND